MSIFRLLNYVLHLLKFGDSAVSALNQVGGLLTDVPRHLSPVALDEGLGLIPLHGLQDARQHEHTALQTVVCTLRRTLGQSATNVCVGGGRSWLGVPATCGISFEPRALGPSLFR